MHGVFTIKFLIKNKQNTNKQNDKNNNSRRQSEKVGQGGPWVAVGSCKPLCRLLGGTPHFLHGSTYSY